jgi:acyl-CoA thioesterase
MTIDYQALAEKSFTDFNGKSGLDYLNHVIATHHTYPFGALLNMRVIKAGDGTSTIEATPDYKFYNPMKRIHGGFLAAVVDSSMGSAVITKLPAGAGAGTVNLSIHFVRKVDVDTGVLTASAKVLHSGRTMLTAETKITDAAGKLYVHGTGTFLVYPK